MTNTKVLKKGFTLIELIVVMAIIAILAAVSVVGYTKYIEKSRESVALQEIAQIENIMTIDSLDPSYDEDFTFVNGEIKYVNGTYSQFSDVVGELETLFDNAITEAGLTANDGSSWGDIVVTVSSDKVTVKFTDFRGTEVTRTYKFNQNGLGLSS